MTQMGVTTLNMLRPLLLILLLSGFSFLPPSSVARAEEPRTPLNSIKWREIGPWRGGRSSAVSGVPGQPLVYYMGASGGGVWKTTNGGASWTNLSDEQFHIGTIGAIAVAPSDPNVVYVGTGESPIRGVTTQQGDGAYRSTDAGKTWSRIGLDGTGQIARIRVHPDDSDTAWAAVQGHIWGPNAERGVFKTTDGGETWRHVLEVNADTGATDLVLDPTNPRVLYAALWHHGRTPWFIKSGGAGGGIYKSVDGGENWEKLAGGLPELVGKIGIDVPRSNPERVYAIVEALPGEGGLYHSADGGASWQLVNETRVIQARAWYYNRVSVDPNDADTLWVLNVPLMKSIDGGRSFERLYTPHGDHHDQWVNPSDSLNFINANDGGATVTFDGGATWSSIVNQPTAQFYRVVTDRQDPFLMYGGQQDNTTLAIASASHDAGIGPADYYDVGGGESAHIAFDLDTPSLVYATTINGTLTEYNHDSKETRYIMPYPEHVFGMNSRDLKYRTNWNAPVALSPHDSSVIYYGTHVLLRSTDRGLSWQEISPDLTRNDIEKQGLNGGPITPENVGAEFYNTIFYVVESPLEAGVIWVGSDDGLVHLSRDGGEDWRDVTPRGAPEGMINAIELSPHEPGTAWITIARYKLNDFEPHIYVTRDYGNRWQRIDADLPRDDFVRVVREDLEVPGVLYAGSEAGMYISFDEGKRWQRMRGNFPPVPVTDLALREDSLVAATQGRGFWVLDDLAAIRQLDGGFADQPLHVLSPGTARLGRPTGRAGQFEGANPPAGVVFNYWLGSETELPLIIEIKDADGELVRRYASEKSDFDHCVENNEDLVRPLKLSFPTTQPGMNRWEWDLRGLPLHCIDNARMFAGFGGVMVAPGEYSATFTLGEHTRQVPLQVQPDPRVSASEDAVRNWRTGLRELAGLYNEIARAIESVRTSRGAVTSLLERFPEEMELGEIGAKTVAALSAWESVVTQLKLETYEDEDSWPSLIDVQVRMLLRSVESSGAPISAGALERKSDLEKQWDMHRRELQAITSGDLSAVNRWAASRKVEFVPSPTAQ